jgi:uncharacterized protein
VVADFLKGLIKLAAAGVKALEGTPEGVKSHSGRAAELWRGVSRSLEAGHATFMGFRIEALICLADTIHQNGWPSQRSILVPNIASHTSVPGSSNEIDSP